MLVALLGLSKLKANDDVRQLQVIPEHLKLKQIFINHVLGGYEPARFFLIQAENEQRLLERQELLIERLDESDAVGNHQSLVTILPSLKKQKENLKMIKEFFLKNPDEFSQHLSRLGFSPAAIDQALKDIQAPFQAGLNPKSFFALPFSDALEKSLVGSNTRWIWGSRSIARNRQ